MQAEHEKLILDNQGLVMSIVLKYHKGQYEFEELASVGKIGLIDAAINFDKEKGNQFSTFASRCIRNKIFMYFRKNNRHIPVLSLETPICTDSDGNQGVIADTLTDSKSVEDALIRVCECQRVRELVNTVLKGKEKQVIILRYGLNGSDVCTQEEVSQQLGFSQSYVSRIEKTALEKLRYKIMKEW